MSSERLIARKILVRGLVQGVGFRPFIYRLAHKLQLYGWVENNNEGVSIHAEGSSKALEQFLNDILKEAPLASCISEIKSDITKLQDFIDFSIVKSTVVSNAVTEVSPDIAVCEACLLDMKTQVHRLDYPFTNCTHCGPRFTIIRDLPYDRHLTSMQSFTMCDTCRSEYETILDRRFHAQPVACKICGPKYKIEKPTSDQHLSDIQKYIAHSIDKGQIVALKGMGGYILCCDAHQEKAVKQLRDRKNRDRKPFAVMCRTLEIARSYHYIDEKEAELLQSWRRPIVLLRNKPESFAPSVSYTLNTTGVVLPYMPLHVQIFEWLRTDTIVFTSGNNSDEPVCITESDACDNLSHIADSIISYNREIHNRADDSVVMVINGKERLIRRSRGYAPSPIVTPFDVEGIFATGAELTNTFALGKGKQIIFSQHIGDLQNAETMAFYEESVQRFFRLFRFQLMGVAHDIHPSYLSTRFALRLETQRFDIQHHHAHIASCMAEHQLDATVIGFAFDGTGLGNDNTIWGGEVLICNLLEFSRRYHFDPVPLPGGDKVTKYLWRTALSYLYKYFGEPILYSGLAFLKDIKPNEIAQLTHMIEKGLNSPLSSGAGRLFDAVAALIGLVKVSDYHAEGPMMLEAIIESDCKSKYPYTIEDKTIVFYKMFYKILQDIDLNKSNGHISAKFHNTLLAIILDTAKRIRKETKLNKVVLSGGTFQNRYLLRGAEVMLTSCGFEVFSHSRVPSNDGGIALGQAVIAAKRRLAKSAN